MDGLPASTDFPQSLKTVESNLLLTQSPRFEYIDWNDVFFAENASKDSMTRKTSGGLSHDYMLFLRFAINHVRSFRLIKTRAWLGIYSCWWIYWVSLSNKLYLSGRALFQNQCNPTPISLFPDFTVFHQISRLTFGVMCNLLIVRGVDLGRPMLVLPCHEVHSYTFLISSCLILL